MDCLHHRAVRILHRPRVDVVTSTERRCQTLSDRSQKLVGYNVKYRLDGREGTVRTSFKPGATLPVKDGQVVVTPPAAA